MSETRYSYAKFGCSVFADNARTYAYHVWACANNAYPPECIPAMLECSCPFDDPLVDWVNPIADPAPWYDPNDPASTEFLGAMILQADGMMDSTISAEVVDAFNDGSIVSRSHLKGRAPVLELLVLSTSCRGADFGIEWLRRVFETDTCGCGPDPCGSCRGKTLQLRLSCSSDTPCDSGLRTYVNVSVVDGIAVQKDDSLDDCCCVAQRVTISLQSESPYSYSCEEIICSTPADEGAFTHCYDWGVDCLECCDKPACDRCLYDPLCACFTEDTLPTSPITASTCWCEPVQKVIQCCCINDISVSGFDNALKIELFSGLDTTNDVFGDIFTENGLRNVRVSIFDNPELLACITDQQSYDDWCAAREDPRFQYEITYIPSNSTLVLDGVSGKLTLECGGICRSYPYEISNAEGSLFPLVTNCDPMMVCVEWDTMNTQFRTGPGTALSSLTVTSFQRRLS